MRSEAYEKASRSRANQGLLLLGSTMFLVYEGQWP